MKKISIFILLGSLSCVTGKPVPEVTRMVLVKGGEFAFGSDKPCKADFQCGETANTQDIKPVYPTMKVKIKPFYIDQHEVTNAQYEYCVDMGGCSGALFETAQTVPALKGVPYFQNDKYADYPVVGVTLEEAKEYCRFVGKRLPTEFEWEYVAKGGGKNLEFPNKYGTDLYKLAPTGSCDGLQVKGCSSTLMPNRVMANTKDVVDLPGGKVYDLTGNVEEWVIGVPVQPEGDKVEYVTCKDGLPRDCTDPHWCFNDACTGDCLDDCYSKNQSCTENKQVFRMCDGFSPSYPICIPWDKTVTPEEVMDYWEAKDRMAFREHAVIRGCSYAGCKGWSPEKYVCGMRSSARIILKTGPDDRSFARGFRCAKDAE